MVPEQRLLIVDYLIDNKDYYKSQFMICEQQKNLLISNENFILRNDINKQYKNFIISQIVDDVSRRLAVPIEDIIIILESIDLNNYLN